MADAHGHDALVGGGQELKVLPHQLCRSHPEGGMVTAQRDETTVVFHHLWIALLVAPVELVDAVGALKTVVHAQLGAQQLLAAEHEGDALRGEHGGLCQQVEAHQLVVADAGDAGLQTVYEAHVVVAAHVRHHLRGLGGIGLAAVVHLRVVHLWVLHHTRQSGHQTHLLAADVCQQRPLGVVAEGAAQGVAYVIAEGGNAWHLLHVGLHAQLLGGQPTLAGAPALSIY